MNYLDLLDEMMDIAPAKPSGPTSALATKAAASDKDYLDLINDMLSDADVTLSPRRA
jgi:hypothetical protein